MTQTRAHVGFKMAWSRDSKGLKGSGSSMFPLGFGVYG